MNKSTRRIARRTFDIVELSRSYRDCGERERVCKVPQLLTYSLAQVALGLSSGCASHGGKTRKRLRFPVMQQVHDA